jgi:hypothetical protein
MPNVCVRAVAKTVNEPESPKARGARGGLRAALWYAASGLATGG